jgi:putative toxin-antitoxin system antitoxin component (TIGR02293 family)
MVNQAAPAEEQDFGVVVSLLGGRKVLKRQLRNAFDAHDLISAGLPAAAVIHLAETVVLLQRESAVKHVLGMSVRTLQRQKGTPRPLSQTIGGRTWKFAEVLAQAMRVFGSQSEAESWIGREVSALRGRRPIDLMGTPAGVEMVERVLTQLEFGVYV